MALFEFDEGRLMPAQFGRTAPGGMTGPILHAVRQQVLEIIGRPLFPVTWHDVSGAEKGEQRLTSLDASGQVVSVEVLEQLNSATMIDALSRLADTASLGWTDLAHAYPSGIDGFRYGWANFRDSMPPSPAPGPRLILVVGQIAEHVRPALDVLASSGVEVHEISVRVMSSGRVFIDVQTVGPRMYGHNPNLLLGASQPADRLPELVSMTSDGDAAPGEGESEASESEAGESEARETIVEPQSHGDAERVEDTAPGEPAEEPVAAHAEPVETVDADEETDVVAPSEATGPRGPEMLGRNPRGLEVIATILGADTPLVWARPGGVVEATLKESGTIATDQWSTSDPQEALALADGNAQADGWSAWCLGDQQGPSLVQALEEINAEIAAEYEAAGAPRRGRRARSRH